MVVANYIGLELPGGRPQLVEVLGRRSLRDPRRPRRREPHRRAHLPVQVLDGEAGPQGSGGEPALGSPNTGGLEFFGQLTNSGAFYADLHRHAADERRQPAGDRAERRGASAQRRADDERCRLRHHVGNTTYEAFFVDSGKTVGALTGGGKVFAGSA